LQDDGLVFTQHFARGDAEQKGISDLASGSGDGDANRLFAHGDYSRKVVKRLLFRNPSNTV
jgi:hypothetical protein